MPDRHSTGTPTTCWPSRRCCTPVALSAGEAHAFEQLLSQDQRAREALGLAARAVHTADPDTDPVPDPAYRGRLRARFAPRPPLWAWLCRRRSYPGHPAFWGSAGAAAAAVLVLVLLRAFWAEPSPSPCAAPAAVPVREAQAPHGTELIEPADEREEAHIWAELPHGDHLLKAHHEEAQRRARSERLSRLEESRLRAQTPAYHH